MDVQGIRQLVGVTMYMKQQMWPNTIDGTIKLKTLHSSEGHYFKVVFLSEKEKGARSRTIGALKQSKKSDEKLIDGVFRTD